MIEETAVVIAVDKDEIIIETLKKNSCSSCNINQSCGTGIISKYFKSKTSAFNLKNTVNAKLGDTIIVGIDERVFLFGSFLMYILPLLFMIGFAIIADYLAVLLQFNNAEIFITSMSVIGFIFSFKFVQYLLKNKLNLLRFNPELIRKIL